MQLTAQVKSKDKTICFAIMSVLFFMLAGGGTGLGALDLRDTNIERKKSCFSLIC
jgi:hypothetical protein